MDDTDGSVEDVRPETAGMAAVTASSSLLSSREGAVEPPEQEEVSLGARAWEWLVVHRGQSWRF